MKTILSIKTFVTALATTLVAASAPAQAQNYPQRVITWVVPFAATSVVATAVTKVLMLWKVFMGVSDA